MPNILAILHETMRSFRLGEDARSKFRLAADVLSSRLLRFAKLPGFNARRCATLHGGTQLYYRLNRGDVQGIREVWMDECYVLPEGVSPKIMIDLGGNIGLTSLWMHARFRCEQIISVEPNEQNAALIEQNFASNRIPGKVIRAAVGPEDGEVFFSCTDESNIGHVARHGEQSASTPVPMVSMNTIMSEIPPGRRVDVVKLDIEGGEGALFAGDLGWLDRVDLIVAELHPGLVDCERIRKTVEARGFFFVPTGTLASHSSCMFVRHDHPCAGRLER